MKTHDAMKTHNTKARFCFSAAVDPAAEGRPGVHPAAGLPPGAALTLSAPPAASLTLADGQTERDAELLVAGDYPAKRLKITEQDLDDIVAQFSADTVPIKIEHVSGPLDPLGVVSRVWRDGRKLMGRISFDPLAAPLIARRAVRGLSCGLDYADAARRRLRLSEVSLTLRPHVPTAALLSEEGLSNDEDRVSALEAKLAALDADRRIAELKRGGRVTPATEPLARLLLSAGGGAAVTLADGGTRSVADTAFALLSALPPSVRFAETAPGRRPGADQDDLYGGAGDDLPPLTPAQRDYCRDVLKVDPQKVREAMRTTTRIGASDQPMTPVIPKARA